MTLSGPVVVLEGELKKIQKEIDKLNEEKALRSQADALIEQGIAAENNDDALGAENLRLQAATLREQAKLKRQQFYSLHKNRLNWKKGIVNGYAGYAQSMDTYYSTTLAAHIHYDIAYWWGWGWWPISWRVQFVSCALDGDNDSEYLTDQPLPAAKNDLIYQKAPRWHKQAVLQQQILANIQKRLGYVVDQEKNDAQIGLL